MRNKHLAGIVTVLVLFLLVPVSRAQSGGDVYWHIDPSVKTCSMVVDASLTQDQWHRFATQVGAIMSFKTLAAAKTLGKMKFSIGIDDAFTPVDQHDPAWINTFTHPDETCPLGDRITYPTVRARMGVSNRIDVGGYWTTAPGANYGAVGGEIKYAFLQESRRRPAAAVRASATILTGVPDFNLNLYSLDVLASKKVAVVTPYLGFRHSVVFASETTSKVNLDREIVPLSQGYAGLVYTVWAVNLAAEYDLASVNTFTLTLGFNL